MSAVQESVPGSARRTHIRGGRYVELVIERNRHGYDPFKYGTADDWSAACIRGEVEKFNKASPHIAVFLGENRGHRDFEPRLQEYLRKKFDIRGDWFPQTIESRKMTLADELIIHGPLVDNPLERAHYEIVAQKKRAAQSNPQSESTSGAGWPD